MTSPKEVVANFLSRFSEGDVPAILACMTDDATWWVAGKLKGISGTNDKLALGKLLEQVKPIYINGALRITPSKFVTEGNTVACEAESFAELVDGRIYANQYHFSIEVECGKISSVREYSDTQHMLEIFGR